MPDRLLPRRGLIAAAGLLAAAPGLALAASRKPRVVIKTERGAIVVELEAQKAPLTSANFLRYVDARSYDGGTFFRAARTPGQPRDGTIVGPTRRSVPSRPSGTRARPRPVSGT